jgi:hypothetical protein
VARIYWVLMAFKAWKGYIHTENPSYLTSGCILSIEIFCRRLGHKSDTIASSALIEEFKGDGLVQFVNIYTTVWMAKECSDVQGMRKFVMNGCPARRGTKTFRVPAGWVSSNITGFNECWSHILLSHKCPNQNTHIWYSQCLHNHLSIGILKVGSHSVVLMKSCYFESYCHQSSIIAV